MTLEEEYGPKRPQRCHVRVPVVAKLSLASETIFARATSSNISSGGMYVKGVLSSDASGMSLVAGGDLHLQFVLPGQTAPISLDSEVVWINGSEREFGGAPAVGLGVRFRTPSPRAVTAIEEFIAEFRYPILIIDDDASILTMLERLLSPSYRVWTANDVHEALELLAVTDIAVLILDYQMPGMDGLQFIEEVRRTIPNRRLVTLVYSAYLEQSIVEDMMNVARVFRFLRKGTSVSEIKSAVMEAVEYYGLVVENERLGAELMRANENLERENAILRRQLSDRDALSGIVTQAESMRELLSRVRGVAPHKTSIHIRGETGTGKELVARALHEESPRAGRVFSAFSCAGVPETLIQSTLFGYRRGAFTGADHDQVGLFEQAEGGTVFLDEVAELTPAMQTSLLRVLQEGEVIPLGSVKPTAVDVRIISATHRNLRLEVAEGRFREDLYYRLVVVELVIPPLRERNGDITLLAHHFVAEKAATLGKSVTGLTPEASAALEAWRWPGNVRELENEIERAVIHAVNGGPVTEGCLSATIRGYVRPLTVPEIGADRALPEIVRAVETMAIEAALLRTNHVAARAAELLGIDASTLRKKMKRLQINPPPDTM